MGTCISKCVPHSSTSRQLCVPQDKLVVSEHPPGAASSVQLISDRNHHHSSSSVSSSSCSSSSSSATTSISSSVCASSSSSSSSSSKDGYTRGEPPRASSRPPPHPGGCKRSPARTNPVNLLYLQAYPAGAFPRKLMAEAPRKPHQAPKRERSSSPALVRQKSSRSSHEQSSAVPARCQRQGTEAPPRTPSPSRPGSSARELRQNKVMGHGSRSFSASPSPGRRFDGGAAGVRGAKCISEESKARAAGPLATRKEKLRNTPSPSVPGLLHASRRRRRETSVLRRETSSVHPIAAPLEREVAEIISDGHSGLARMEDMINPLIAMDCFIFL